MTTTTTLYPCSRCEGKGELPHHRSVVGGVCFKCGGSGKQKGKPSTKRGKWLVSMIDAFTGERRIVYRESSSWSQRAVRKVVADRYPSCSVEFRAQYDLATMEVERE